MMNNSYYLIIDQIMNIKYSIAKKVFYSSMTLVAPLKKMNLVMFIMESLQLLETECIYKKEIQGIPLNNC